MSNAIHADVAVVGLGAMGAAALYQLARRGVRAVGIDRFAPPHQLGSSHGETRITRQAVGEGAAYVPFVTKSHEIWRELEAETGETLLVESGALIMDPGGAPSSHHGKPDFVARTAQAATDYGIEHETFGADEARRRFPQFAVAEDVQAYYEPRAGYVIPERCIAAQLTLARALGADVRLGEMATSVAQAGDGVEIGLDGGVIRADRVIVTAGAWIGPLLGPPFNRLLQVKRQTLHWFETEEDASFGERPPVFIWMHGAGDSDYLYGFPPSGGRIKVASEQYAISTTAGSVDRIVRPQESVEMFAAHVRGRIRGVTSKVAKAAACVYTVTPDFGFIIDEHPSQDRITVVSACSGHGFKHSAGVGFAVAEQAVTGRSVIDLSPFSIGRFV
ncbi:N-methyl-L-tryptophan oxidase [Hansschlegelia plantiphila]|uniref:Sarcosine oxidase n=1 Tax=Hansschlegelia plantiphila TaxID=374655 RepID=A0A9W6J0I6_9HYPH|nr:N-methyl-L-tryptophan oxidase [Hansschlegelia plantiphila]GLK67064.1 sarcosine oxidase [Hansschlegelia plantiphila]